MERNVGWSTQRIEDEWLQGGRVAFSDAELARLFDLVESTFGADWLERRRGNSQNAGALPTLLVANAGQLIDAVVDLPGADALLARLRDGQPGSWAELLIIAAIRRADPRIAVTLEPQVTVGLRNRKPDLRLERDGEPVHLEISAAQASRERSYVLGRIKVIAEAALAATPFGNSSEIYLHRDPTAAEVDELATTIATLCAQGGHHVVRNEAANIVTNYSDPITVVPYDFGDAPRPRTCISIAQSDGLTGRHATVRYPYTDQRAAKMLRREAERLPPGSPGIVVLNVTGASGGMREWEALLRDRLRPDQHTRVSAVVLTDTGIHGTPEGEAWMHRTRVIMNEHAARPAPASALAPFLRWADGESHALNGSL
jgi:hypothetical protein